MKLVGAQWRGTHHALVCALVPIALATAATALIWPYGKYAPFSMYYLAVFAAAFYGNGWAGGLAVLLSVVAVDFLFFQPRVGVVFDFQVVVSSALFVALAACAIALARRLSTVERRKRGSDARLGALFGAVQEAIVTLDAGMKVETFNPAAEKMFGCTAKEAIGQGAARFVAFGPDTQGGMAGDDIPALAEAAAIPAAPRTILARRADGSEFPVEASISHIRSSLQSERLFMLVLRDISARKAYEAEIGRLNRLYAARSHINQAIVPDTTRKELLPKVQDKEIALLSEAAADVSFALENFERDEESRRAAEVAVREQVFSATMIESMPGIVYCSDQAGRFLCWNRDFEAVSGYGGSEIAAMHPLDFFSGAAKPLIALRIAEVFEKGQSAVEADFVSKDGSTKPYFMRGRRIMFDGSPCLVGIGIDITQRRQAENALRASEFRHRSTLDSILEACQIIGFDWTYLYLNPASEKQNRRPNAELLGHRMTDMRPGIETSPVFAMLKRCMDERLPQHGEVKFDFADGGTGWFDLRVQPVPEGIFLLSIDITERRKAETALRELNESLERKVGERTGELKIALDRAESADRLKSAFLAAMSHELRTPLNSILGFTGILLQGMAGPLNSEQRTQLGFVRGSARHLLELINDVLDISKIEAGQLEVRAAPFDLQVSIERVVASVRPMALAKGLALEVDAGAMPSPLVSDKRRVEQILLNLLTNAIKFTERGKVTLAVQRRDAPHGGAPDGNAALCLSVSDTGIGIKPEDLQTLFRPFRQIDTGLSRQHEGTGLGLAICRRLATLLGGTMQVQSVWGEGSVFTLALPLAAPE